MTSEASDLPDWKDQIPWCLATEVGDNIFSENLNRSESRCPERKDLGEIMASCEPSFQRENRDHNLTAQGAPREDPVIKRFLAWDINLRLSDKYLLTMVIAYFSRVRGPLLLAVPALYLALDMAENYHAPKQAILSFLYGENNCSQRPLFHKLRFQFFRSMGWRAMVTREECEEIQAFDPELWVWKRDRALLSETT